MIRKCVPDVNTLVRHEADFPRCCPVSGNPAPGSVLQVSYRPTSGRVLPVELLAEWLSEYIGGHANGQREMEATVQEIAQRAAVQIQAPAVARAILLIDPPFGGDQQRMFVRAKGAP